MSEPRLTLSEELRDLPEQYLLREKTQEMIEAVADRLDVIEAVAAAAQAYIDMDDRPSDDQPDDWEYTLGHYLRCALGAANCAADPGEDPT